MLVETEKEGRGRKVMKGMLLKRENVGEEKKRSIRA